MSNLIFYLNGQFLPEDEAKISVLDLGFVRGYGVFDFLRTYNGKPFKLEEHLQRLQNSAKQIALEIPPVSQIKQIVLQTLAKNNLSESGIKIVIGGGDSNDGISPEGKPTLAVIIKPLPVYPENYYTKGIKVITVNYGRELPTVKSTNYISAILAKKLASRKRAVEAIYKNSKNQLLEGTQTNFFIFKKNNLITADQDIFPGITRELVLKLAAREFKINLRLINYKELKEIDEAFISTTSKEVMPVVKIDKLVVGNGKVGYNTKRIMELFRKYTCSSSSFW